MATIEVQSTLFDALAPEPEPARHTEPGLTPALTALSAVQRTHLSAGAWVDVRPNWFVGADDVYAALLRHVPWRAERRTMWDSLVDVPRLVHNYAAGDKLPHPALAAAREALSDHYRHELGEEFMTAGCCNYRDGNDSVAWHGDTIGRGRSEDTMVAIVSFGNPRKLALRPRGGGRSIGFTMGHGDLLVMGGTCQRTWEHAVPKVAHAGQRVSVQFRPADVF